MKYLGNKTRLYDFLFSKMNLSERTGQLGLDLFSGTGSVSYLFKKYGINTISNDLMKFCSYRTSSILLDKSPAKQPKLDSEVDPGFITEKYSERANVNIFKEEIAQHIDGARKYLLLNKQNFTKEEYQYYVAQIIESADYRSNIMGSYESFYKNGWRKQCLKKWLVEDFELIDNKSTTTHIVKNENSLHLLEHLEQKLDFIYLDPPYNSRQYSSVFHVLETIAEYNSPIVKGKVNKSVDCVAKNSNFSSKVKSKEEMKIILERSFNLTNEVFMSYSNEGILTKDYIMQEFLKHCKEVVVHEYDYRKFKTNSAVKNKTVKEFLFHGNK